jgi:DNA-binding winged helix-turn-helix (wHTH) protein/Tol biopolymer transport system component
MSAKIRFGVYELDQYALELRKKGMLVRLPEQPCRILAILAQRPGELVTREELQALLWADTFVDFDHSLNKAVNRLREALKDNAGTPQYIETVPRRGYRFIAPVASLPEAEAPESTKNDEPGPATATSRRLRFLIPSLTVAGICGLVAAIWFWKPLPSHLKITDSFQLTSDGHSKGGDIVTDGARLYFAETIAGHTVAVAVPISGGEPVPIHSPFPDISVSGLSPDKSQLLIGEGFLIQDHPMWLLPIVGGPVRRLANVVAHSASWSPDGKHFAYARGGDVYLAKADGSDPQPLFTGSQDPKVWAWQPRWSPDSHRVRFSLYQMEKHVSSLWEITADGKDLHKLSLPTGGLAMQGSGEWTAGGKYYLFNSWNSLAASTPSTNLWGVREGSGLFRKNDATPFQITAGPMHSFDWIPDPSRNVLYTLSAKNHGELMRYDLKKSRVVPFLSAMSAEAVSFSADGAWVAYVKFPQGELWRSRTNGSDALQLTSSPLFASFPSWSADGSRIAFGGQSVGQYHQLYVVPANGGPMQLLPGTEKGIWMQA